MCKSTTDTSTKQCKCEEIEITPSSGCVFRDMRTCKVPELATLRAQLERFTNALGPGDFSITRAEGDPMGEGLPTRLMMRKGEEYHETYVPESCLQEEVKRREEAEENCKNFFAALEHVTDDPKGSYTVVGKWSLLSAIMEKEGYHPQLIYGLKHRAEEAEKELTQARSQLRVLSEAVLEAHKYAAIAKGNDGYCDCSFCQLAREVVK